MRVVIDGNGTNLLVGGISGMSRWMRSNRRWVGGRVARCGGVAFTGWVWCVAVLNGVSGGCLGWFLLN